MATEGQSQLPFEESYGLDLWLKDQVTIRSMNRVSDNIDKEGDSTGFFGVIMKQRA